MHSLKTTAALLIVVLTTGCINKDFDPKTWDIEQTLSISENILAFSSAAGTDTITVSTNYSSYSLSIRFEDDNADGNWCTLSKIDSTGSFVVSVSPNMSVAQRKADITVRIGHNKETAVSLPVVQMGGKWEIIGPFTLFLTQDISESQKNALSGLLDNMVKVDGGTFEMGEDSGYEVTLDDYYIGRYELTQKQWMAVMGKNPSQFTGENKPVENITWREAMEFCERLSSLTNLNFSLPTEAQWEYAATGGRFSRGYLYSGSDDYTKVAHVCYGIDEGSPLYTTAEIGTKTPNELGLYDMTGNVSEFCFDYYDELPSGHYDNPSGPSVGYSHVLRGGDFGTLLLEVKSRDSFWDDSTIYNCDSDFRGLRIVLNI